MFLLEDIVINVCTHMNTADCYPLGNLGILETWRSSGDLLFCLYTIWSEQLRDLSRVPALRSAHVFQISLLYEI